jgi:hypothetical protein
MRSQHAHTFNHDEWAAGYDADVADETNPIRAGYQATLGWVVERAAVGPDDAVVDLGIGTGNLARLGCCPAGGSSASTSRPRCWSWPRRSSGPRSSW